MTYSKFINVDRNSLCPCGSGKKYKHCCKELFDEYSKKKTLSYPELAFVFVKLAYSIIYKKHVDDFKEKLKLIPPEKMLDIISYYDKDLSEHDFYNSEYISFICNDLFRGSLLEKIKIIIQSDSRVVFVNDLLVLNVFKFYLLNYDTPKDDITSEEIRDIIGDSFLEINDYPHVRKEDPVTFLEQYTISNLMIIKTDNPRLFILRNKIIFIDIPKLFKLKFHPDYINLNKLFKKKTKINLIDYFSLVFFVSASFLKRTVIDENIIFRQTKYKNNQIESFFNMIRLNWDDYKRCIDNECRDLGDISNKLVTIKNYPLIKHNNLTYSISRNFILQKIDENLYWYFSDFIEDDYGEISWKKYTRYFGVIFEEYIFKLLKYIKYKNYKKRLKVKNIKKRQSKPEIDLLLYDNDRIAVFEIKSSRLNLKTVETGNIKSFIKDLKKTYARCVKQTKNSIACLLNNEYSVPFEVEKVKKIYPIFLFIEPMPLETWILKYYHNILARYKYFNNSLKIMVPTIMDVADFERCLDLIEKNEFFDLLEERINNSIFMGKSFNNFLFFKFKKTTTIPKSFQNDINKFFRKIKRGYKLEKDL